MSNAFDFGDDFSPSLQRIAYAPSSGPGVGDTSTPPPPPAAKAEATPEPPPEPPQHPPEPPAPPTPPAASLPQSPVSPEALYRQWKNPQTPTREPFQSYVPSGLVGFEHWGKKHWAEDAHDVYPDIGRSSSGVAPGEVYGIMRGAGQQLGQWASPAVAPLAMAAGAIGKTLGPFIDMLSGGGRHPFTRAFTAAETQSLNKQKFLWQQQREYFEMQREQMLDYADAAVRAQRAEIEPARDIIEKYRNNVYSDNPGENERLATQALDEWANRHPVVQQALRNGGLRAAENQLNWEAAKINDLANAARSGRASDARRREATSAKGLPTDLDRDWSLEGEGGEDRYTRDPRGQLVLPGKPKPPTPPDTEKQSELDEMSDVDKDIAQRRGLSQAAMTAAHQIFRDGTVQGMTRQQLKTGAPKKFGDVISAGGDLDRLVRKAASDPNLTPDEKIEAINKVDPAYGSKIDGLRKYEIDPASLKTNQDRDTSVARLVDQSYHPGFFKIAQKYKDPNTKEGSIINRTATVPTSYLALLRALRPIKEGDPNLKRVMEKITDQFWTGDPRYLEVHQAIRNYLTDVGGVQMGTGTPRVTLIAEAAKTMTATTSPAQLRQQALVDLIPTFGMINQINRAWQRETQSDTNAPLYDPQNARLLDAMVRMNGYTGEVPEDAPDELKAVGKSPPAGKEKPGWMTDKMMTKPLTRENVNKWRGWLESHPNHPEAQAVRELLGIIPDLRPQYGR